MKKAVKIGIIALLTGSVAALLAFVNSRPKKVSCRNIQVSIDYFEDAYFINEEEVDAIIEGFCNETGGEFLDEKTSVTMLEMKLMEHPAVKKCEIYTKVNGRMHVDIYQRKPIGRIVNKRGDSFYMDMDGKLMPQIPGRPARVVVVNGNIRESYAPNAYYLDNDSAASISILDEVYEMLKVIDTSKFWKSEIEQVYIDENKEFVLIPKVGMHEILFGKADHIPGKFNKLEWFYKKGLPAEGWKTYRTIDIRYQGQVVCKGSENLFELPVDNVNFVPDTITNQ